MRRWQIRATEVLMGRRTSACSFDSQSSGRSGPAEPALRTRQSTPIRSNSPAIEGGDRDPDGAEPARICARDLAHLAAGQGGHQAVGMLLDEKEAPKHRRRVRLPTTSTERLPQHTGISPHGTGRRSEPSSRIESERGGEQRSGRRTIRPRRPARTSSAGSHQPKPSMKPKSRQPRRSGAHRLKSTSIGGVSTMQRIETAPLSVRWIGERGTIPRDPSAFPGSSPLRLPVGTGPAGRRGPRPPIRAPGSDTRERTNAAGAL